MLRHYVVDDARYLRHVVWRVAPSELSQLANIRRLENTPESRFISSFFQVGVGIGYLFLADLNMHKTASDWSLPFAIRSFSNCNIDKRAMTLYSLLMRTMPDLHWEFPVISAFVLSLALLI